MSDDRPDDKKPDGTDPTHDDPTSAPPEDKPTWTELGVPPEMVEEHEKGPPIEMVEPPPELSEQTVEALAKKAGTSPPEDGPTPPDEVPPLPPPDGPPPRSSMPCWQRCLLTLLVSAAICLPAGMMLGWMTRRPAQVKRIMVPCDPCGSDQAAKDLRNQAWRVMNDEPEGAPGWVMETTTLLRAILVDGLPPQIRARALIQYMQKGSRYRNRVEAKVWATQLVSGNGPARLEALRRFVRQDHDGATLARCLLKDTARIQKVIAEQKVPLE